MEEILNNLNNQFCGCTHVTGSIQIDMFGFDGYTNLNEDSFNFLYHVEQISGVLRFQNIPTVERIVFPNLHIIRGEKLIPTEEGRGLALVLLNTSIGALVLPNLTEVTRGDVRFENTTSSMCNYRTVNWNDIIDNGQLVELLACNTSRPEGEEMTCRYISQGACDPFDHHQLCTMLHIVLLATLLVASLKKSAWVGTVLISMLRLYSCWLRLPA